jgi:hypothetical protein
MIELRTAIQAQLETIHSRVFFQDVPSGTEFPYIVFDIPNILDDGESMEVAVVDIDGWSKGADTTTIETLMAAVNLGLDKKTLNNVPFYLETKLTLQDDDPRIQRRKYTYQAKLFKRG